ncbi:MAG: YjbQ family protein [Gammaproteobacteria bacterium]|nr:YjbQ family protein [Gammaproteobacteria bacterium]
MIFQSQLQVITPGRRIVDITKDIAKVIAECEVTTGLCNVFLHHTSASLILCENADPLVQQDLETFMQRLVPDGDPLYQHVEEGPDDMPAHVRAILTSNSLTIPITGKKLALGTWQGVYIWEHRIKSYTRRLTVTVQGS